MALTTQLVTTYFRDPDAMLSEGITYRAQTREMYWVDIYHAQIHRVADVDNPEQSHSTYAISPVTYCATSVYPGSTDTVERVGCLFPSLSEGSKLLFAAKRGIAELDLATCSWKYVYLYADSGLNKDWNRLRSNDGSIAPNGTEIYVGLMVDFSAGGPDTSKAPEGCVLRIHLKARRCDLVLDGIHIPNAINWSVDGSQFYLTDSLAFTIWACPVVDGIPQFLEKRPFYCTKNTSNDSHASPEPDGGFVDYSTGHTFVAVWSTGKVQELDCAGNLVATYTLPTPRVTCCCAGPAGELLVSTAHAGDFDTGAHSDGVGGSIFRVMIPGRRLTQAANPAPC
ncbi:AaceriABL098Wp [[Ashbya] aceris (nom. inval.)]|nr:AaceriABL098Wp [[Ashbya] aceris (nom. inval.)]